MTREHPAIPLGPYRHYKGGLYEVVCVATHVDTHDPFVVYRSLGGDVRIYLRPYHDFTGTVCPDGADRPRFEFAGHGRPVITRNDAKAMDCPFPPGDDI